MKGKEVEIESEVRKIREIKMYIGIACSLGPTPLYIGHRSKICIKKLVYIALKISHDTSSF